MEENKAGYSTIDQYIAQFSPGVQAILEKLRSTIRESAPGAVEKISYQMPAFALNGILVYFAAHKEHIGFYPTASGVEAFKDELSRYKTSKGAIRFPIDEPLPLDLVSRIVKFKVAENTAKAEGKPARK